MATTQQKKDEDQEPEVAAKEAVKATETSEEDERFDVDWIVSDGWASLGHPQHEVAGALSGISKKTLTLGEAAAAVKAWLKAPVKEA